MRRQLGFIGMIVGGILVAKAGYASTLCCPSYIGNIVGCNYSNPGPAPTCTGGLACNCAGSDIPFCNPAGPQMGPGCATYLCGCTPNPNPPPIPPPVPPVPPVTPPVPPPTIPANPGCAGAGICGTLLADEDHSTAIANTTMELRDEKNSLIARTLTNSSGKFQFTALTTSDSYHVSGLPGRLQEVLPASQVVTALPSSGYQVDFTLNKNRGAISFTGCTDGTFILITTSSVTTSGTPPYRAGQSQAMWTGTSSGKQFRISVLAQRLGDSPYYVTMWIPKQTGPGSETYQKNPAGSIPVPSLVAVFKTVTMACP